MSEFYQEAPRLANRYETDGFLRSSLRVTRDFASGLAAIGESR